MAVLQEQQRAGERPVRNTRSASFFSGLQRNGFTPWCQLDVCLLSPHGTRRLTSKLSRSPWAKRSGCRLQRKVRAVPGDLEEDYATSAPQPWGLWTRSAETGYLPSFAVGRRGRRTSSPPQLGQMPKSLALEQAKQNVHSNEQITASSASGGKFVLQHSQEGRSWSTKILLSRSSPVAPLFAFPLGMVLIGSETRRSRSPGSRGAFQCVRCNERLGRIAW